MSDRFAPRNRAAAIVINNEQLLVIYRKNRREFYTLPGGGIETAETNERAAVREVKEETSIDIEIGRLVYELHYENGAKHYYFLSKYLGGNPEVMEGTEEAKDNQLGQNIYIPKWLPIKDLPQVQFYPLEVRDKLVNDLSFGFSDKIISFELPNWQ